VGASERSTVPDYPSVTEVTGEAVRRDAIEKIWARYAFAAERAQARDVLEVACGSGQGLGVLARRARSVVAGDYTFDLVQGLARHYRGRVRSLVLDGQFLPFRDGSFDMVLCYEALYYFADADRFCAEAARVLRPRGELLVVNVNPRWPGFNPSPYSTRYHDAGELRGLLERHGLAADVRGAFPEHEGGALSRAVGLVRRAAVALHLVPKTMRAKRLLKRFFYGKLVVLPPELVGDPPPPPAMMSVTNQSFPTVLYAVGRRTSNAGIG
jgi:SAM-dependent methyltransferase